MEPGSVGGLSRVGQVWHVKCGSAPGVYLVLRTEPRESGILQHVCLVLDSERNGYMDLTHTFYETAKRAWESYKASEIERLT